MGWESGGSGDLGAGFDPDQGVLAALEGVRWEGHIRSAYKEGRKMAGLCVKERWYRGKVRGREAGRQGLWSNEVEGGRALG